MRGVIFQEPQIFLVGPADGASLAAITPDFTAEYASFLDAGIIEFEVDITTAFDSPRKQSGSASGLSDGDVGLWTASTLMAGRYYWRARATNEVGVSPWSETRTFVILGMTKRALYQYENVAKLDVWTKKRALYQYENVAKLDVFTDTRALYQYENITTDPPTPFIDRLSRYRGTVGSTVTIYGNGFGGKQASDPENPDRAQRGYGGHVYLGLLECGIVAWGWQEITFTIPGGAVSGAVKVTLTTPDPPGVRDSNVIGFEVYEPEETHDVGLELFVCDKANPNQVLAVLDGAQRKAFQKLLNAPGGGRFVIPRRDLKGGDRTIIADGNYVVCKIDGVERFRWVIESRQPVYVEEGDASAEAIEVTGRGLLALLETAVVYPEVMPDPVSLEREWLGAHAGAILAALIGEAQARGCLSWLSIDFTVDHDSLGNPWTDATDISFHAGTSLLAVVEKMCGALGLFDVEITPSMVLRAYKGGKGEDRSDLIRYMPGQGILRHRNFSDAAKITNVVLVEGEDGSLVEVTHPTSPGVWGRREGYLQARNIPDDFTQLSNYGDSFLRTNAEPTWGIQLEVDEQPFEWFDEYDLGDWIWVNIPPAGSDTVGFDGKLRVKGFTVEEDPDTARLKATLELNTILLEHQIRMAQMLERLASGSGDPVLTNPAERPPIVAHGNLEGLTEGDPHTQYLTGDRESAAARGICFDLAEDKDGALTSGPDKGTFIVPKNMALTIASVYLSVKTAPSGQDLVIDIHKNGSTIFTTQANRPKIAAGATSAESGAPDIVSIAAGDRITVDVDQVGTTETGKHLAVTINCSV